MHAVREEDGHVSKMKDSEIVDRDLLEVMLKEREGELTEEQLVAFTEIADQKWPLSQRQSDWIRGVAKRLGLLSPAAENVFSNMPPEEQAKHRSKVVTQLPWETGAMKRPAKPPGGKP